MRLRARCSTGSSSLAGRDGAPSGAVPAGVDERLAEIAWRLDELRTAAPDADAARGLEARLVHLSESISHLMAGEDQAVVTPRLDAIEEHLDTTDEYIIEAARQAAEAVVEAYGRNRGSGQGAAQAGEIAVLSELAEDLRALERLSQKSEERTARAFDAVHDTLVKIAEHLEAIGPHRAGAAPEEEPAEQDAGPDGDDWRDEAPRLAGAASETRLPAVGRQRLARPEEDAKEGARSTLSVDGGFGGEIEAQEKPARRKGLLAKVGERMRPSRRQRRPDDGEEAPEQRARTNVALAPSIDPTAALDGSRDKDEDREDGAPPNEPLEPGSGAPDIDRILRKVREVQNRDADQDDKSDFIAAARRAAQAAAAEVETVSGTRKRKRSGGLAAMIKGQRRPILLAVGAVLLVVMSWPLASALLRRPDAALAVHASARAANKSRAEVAPVSDEKTGATSVAGPSLPKVRAIGQDNSFAKAQPVKAQAVGAGSLESAEVPSAVGAAAGSVRPESPRPTSGSTSAQVEPGTGPALKVTAAPAQQAEAAAPGRSGSSIRRDGLRGRPHGTEVSQPPAAQPAGADATAAADAVPQLPDAIGPQSMRAAAKNGDPKALYEIGVLYSEGRGVSTDLATAAKWYRAAAKRGLAPAEYRLANLYEKGAGVDRDMVEARKWYLKAADQGNISAMHNLAVLYAMGKDGKPDYASAAEWFQKAADHGVRDSQFNLAILFAQGHGVPRDLVQSYKWFAVAARTGDSDATQKRDEVAAALDAADLKKARAAVADWKAEPVATSANEVSVPPEWNGADTRTASVDMSKAIRNIQAILDGNGFDAGKPDGIMGEKTRSAIKAFQKSVGDEPSGKITDALIKKLLDLNQRRKEAGNS